MYSRYAGFRQIYVHVFCWILGLRGHSRTREREIEREREREREWEKKRKERGFWKREFERERERGKEGTDRRMRFRGNDLRFPTSYARASHCSLQWNIPKNQFVSYLALVSSCGEKFWISEELICTLLVHLRYDFTSLSMGRSTLRGFLIVLIRSEPKSSTSCLTITIWIFLFLLISLTVSNNSFEAKSIPLLKVPTTILRCSSGQTSRINL